jgi:hypothetical protein
MDGYPDSDAHVHYDLHLDEHIDHDGNINVDVYPHFDEHGYA